MSYLGLAAGVAGLHVALSWGLAWRHGRAAACYQEAKPRPARPAQLPPVSVLVPAWRERTTIGCCIASLSQITYPVWELIVIAGGPDGTFAAAVEACAAQPNSLVLFQEPRGKNAALNAGLAAASGELIVILDADSQVREGWLEALVAALDGPAGAAFGHPSPLRWTPVSAHEELEHIATWQVQGALILQGSGSIVVRRELLVALGGFPEEVRVGVDWDLSARLVQRGVKLAYASEAIVATERPATLGEYWRNELRWRRAHLSWLLRPPEGKRPLRATLTGLYLYGLAWVGLLTGLLALALLASGPTALAAASWWGLMAGWVLLRSSSLTFAVAAYTGQLAWLRLACVSPLLLGLTCTAIIIASLSLSADQTHFKGPRQREEPRAS